MRRRGVTAVEFALYAALIFTLFAVLVISTPGSTPSSASATSLKDQALLVDMALAYWYRTHSGTYPATLTPLKDVTLLPVNIDLSVFSYAVRNGNTEYRLTVSLPVGGTYVSPNSKY